MSRSAARSRAEKPKEPKGGPAVQASTASAQRLEAEAPGRLTRAQRVDLLMHEDADEIVGELMDELLGRVLEGCYKVHADKQVVHLCASWAKNYITRVLQQQLLSVDEGEEPEELSKTEDPEPSPGIPDVWVQGCVPFTTVTPLPHSSLQQVRAKQGSGVDHRHTAAAQTNDSKNQPEAETSPRRPVSNKDDKGFSQHTPPKLERKKKQTFTINPKPVPGRLLPSLSRSTKDSSVPSEGKTRAHHNNKAEPFYQPKVRQSIPKLDPAALPRQWVVPLYEVVDKNCTNPKKPSGLSKLESKSKKQQAERTGPSLKLLQSSKDQPTEFQRRNDADVSLKDMSQSSHRKEGMVSTGFVRLDRMVLAKGVTLLDPKSAEMDPPRSYLSKQPTKMRPIRSAPAMPLFSADQITSGPPPKVTPLIQPVQPDSSAD